MQSTLPAGKPAVGIGYDSAIGWYVWFGHSPGTAVRVPLKVVAKPFKAAGASARTAATMTGRTMAANPLLLSAVLVGMSAGWYMERQARTKAEDAHAFESARANVAEKDRDEARSKAEDLDTQIKLGYQPMVKPSQDEISKIRAMFNIDDNYRNIAVCGRVSAGKSAFVNSVRGLSPSHRDAAPIGNEETTREIRGYEDPHVSIIWWDIPGSGGQISKDWFYCTKHSLFAFDQIILVHEQVFSSTELGIYRQCVKNGKEVLIVRTQSDNNLRRIINDDDADDDGWDPVDLVHRYVSSSREATEKVLEDNELPVPPRLFHITSRLLRWERCERGQSPVVRADRFLQRIDEGPLLIELGIKDRPWPASD